MSVDFNHTILPARDSRSSAVFLAEMLSLPEPRKWGPFWMVTTDNGANLDYMDVDRPIAPQHYAFLVDDESFDAILARIEKAGLAYWADPGRSTPGLNRHDGGRGLYFDDLEGHLLEVITRPYGSGGWQP
ncbi:VOC family protein [Nitratireductor pacificus]|uniref:Putative glyoxalase/bleomycin resistance protein/dioxygenase n=1 Tax=Nitratireductor pacificus pht-3B TaxID=391937 RepID=K2N1V0_9HYPH|nr:VOC family protein [Nitratireductor pacificus]EKF18158.1 putative glyoxalase/bleomycin resistance protein/dioxygenase [Nitratireductor pacificus pht-3B]